MKAYRVTFGAVEDGDDIINLDCKIILARDVPNAIICAMECLTKKQLKKYYAQEVEIVTVMSNYLKK